MSTCTYHSYIAATGRGGVFSKVCSKYLGRHPGRVITTDKLASLVAKAWPNSFTAVNVMSGFKKSGIYPLNPGQVTDQQLAPSKALRPQPQNTETAPTTEHEALYQRRYEEHYDISDTSYVAWLKIYHPEAATLSITTSSSSGKQDSNSLDVLSEVLVLPEPQARKRKTAPAKRIVCIMDDDVFESMLLLQLQHHPHLGNRILTHWMFYLKFLFSLNHKLERGKQL